MVETKSFATEKQCMEESVVSVDAYRGFESKYAITAFCVRGTPNAPVSALEYYFPEEK